MKVDMKLVRQNDVLAKNSFTKYPTTPQKLLNEIIQSNERETFQLMSNTDCIRHYNDSHTDDYWENNGSYHLFRTHGNMSGMLDVWKYLPDVRKALA